MHAALQHSGRKLEGALAVCWHRLFHSSTEVDARLAGAQHGVQDHHERAFR